LRRVPGRDRQARGRRQRDGGRRAHGDLPRGRSPARGGGGRAGQSPPRRPGELNAEAGGAGPLAMHIGVNTGAALLGATKIEGRAGTRWTYTASGLTTNIAARLAAAASGGEVVLSESTWGRLNAEFACEDLGPRELKNVDAPVRLYRIVGGERGPFPGPR